LAWEARWHKPSDKFWMVRRQSPFECATEPCSKPEPRTSHGFKGIQRLTILILHMNIYRTIHYALQLHTIYIEIL
jgi:hypothetical protein